MQRDKNTYKGSKLLKPTNVAIEYTEEQIKEIIKCKNDPIHFIETYMKIVSLDDGIIPFKMYDFQRKMVETFHKNSYSLIKLPRQSGKCFCDTTKIRLKNKTTGDIIEKTIGEFYEEIQDT